MADHEPIDQLASSTVLPYADEIAQSGVRVQRQSGLIQVIVPPQWKWWPLSTAMIGYLIAIAIFLIAFSIAGIASLVHGEHELIPAAIEYGIISAALIYVVAGRLLRWRVLEVTSDRLTRRDLTFGRLREAGSWPREKVLEVKYSEISGKLIWRIRGQDMREIPLTPSVAANHHIVDALNAAMTELPRSSLINADDTATADTEQTRRTRLGSGSGAIIPLMLVGLLAIPFGPVGLLAGLGLIGIATIVAGIRGGTQQNKFWT